MGRVRWSWRQNGDAWEPTGGVIRVPSPTRQPHPSTRSPLHTSPPHCTQSPSSTPHAFSLLLTPTQLTLSSSTAVSPPLPPLLPLIHHFPSIIRPLKEIITDEYYNESYVCNEDEEVAGVSSSHDASYRACQILLLRTTFIHLRVISVSINNFLPSLPT
nr:hypothetical transcript [Hymenolepis microstoma]